MQSCEIPSVNMLPSQVEKISVEDSACDFDCAKQKAISTASRDDNAPQLISWFSKKDQSYYPSDECCVEGEPSWLSFALAKGADLAVDINDEEYVFMFQKSHGQP